MDTHTEQQTELDPFANGPAVTTPTIPPIVVECQRLQDEVENLKTEKAKLERENAALRQRHDDLVRQIRGVGARIPCATGGTFETDPPDAIVDACWRECRDVKTENAALRADKERLLVKLRDSEHSLSVWMQHAKQSDQKLAAAQQAHQCDLDRRANVGKSLRKVEAENAALRADAATLCEIIDHANPGAWANGNTHLDGYGPDEGEVLMSDLYSPLRGKYYRAQGGAK